MALSLLDIAMSLVALAPLAITPAARTASSIAAAVPPQSLPGKRRSPPAGDARRGCLDIELNLRHAGTRKVRVGYECVGPDQAPAVLVAGGISAHRHVLASETFPEAGWWQVQARIGFDVGATRVVAIDWLGADGSVDAPIDPADQADAIATVLDALGIDRLHAFVGCSYGAMVGLHFAAHHASRLSRLLAISGSHRAHPYASAWRALQRQVVALGQLQCDAGQGLSLARQLAMLSYRTPEEFAERFAAAPTIAHARLRVAAEDYLDVCGANYVARTLPAAFLRRRSIVCMRSIPMRAGADHRGRGAGRPSGAGRRCLFSGRTLARLPAKAVALEIRTRCLPERAGADRCDPARRAARYRCGGRMNASALAPATRAVRAGIDCDAAFGAVTPPIVLSSNFSFAGFDEKRQYDYTRSGNRTRFPRRGVDGTGSGCRAGW